MTSTSLKVMNPYFVLENEMLAKMTAKNQLTLPKSMIAQVGCAEYFDVEARNGQLVPPPVRIHPAMLFALN